MKNTAGTSLVLSIQFYAVALFRMPWEKYNKKYNKESTYLCLQQEMVLTSRRLGVLICYQCVLDCSLAVQPSISLPNNAVIA